MKANALLFVQGYPVPFRLVAYLSTHLLGAHVTQRGVVLMPERLILDVVVHLTGVRVPVAKEALKERWVHLARCSELPHGMPEGMR